MARTELIARYLAAVEQRLAGEPLDRDRMLAELAGHLDDAIDQRVAAGMAEDEAVRAAVAGLGTHDELLAAVRANDDEGRRIMAFTRWTGVAGLVAVPLAVAGTVAWNWYVAMLALALAAAAIVGILAAHWRSSRRFVAAALGVCVAGNLAAATATVGQDSALRAVGVPALLTLTALLIVGYAMLRAGVLPTAAVALVLVGVTILLGVNTALYVADREPPLLAGLGGILAVTGWVWLNGALASRRRDLHPAAA